MLETEEQADDGGVCQAGAQGPGPGTHVPTESTIVAFVPVNGVKLLFGELDAGALISKDSPATVTTLKAVLHGGEEEGYGVGAAHQNYFTHWTGRRGTVVEVELERIVCGILASRTADAASSPWLIPAADQDRAKQMLNTRQQHSKKRKRS